MKSNVLISLASWYGRRVNNNDFITRVLWVKFPHWYSLFHDSVQRCHYQCAWLVSTWLIRFSIGQLALSGLPWSASPPILWTFSGGAVSMQSWTIKGKWFRPPAVLWESAAPASSAYFDHSGYKWTFTSMRPWKDSPGPSSPISLFNNPYLKGPELWERGAEGKHFFHLREQK